MVKTKSSRFIGRNKKDKIKRSSLYQDLDTGGIRMTDVNIMLTAWKVKFQLKIYSFDRIGMLFGHFNAKT